MKSLSATASIAMAVLVAVSPCALAIATPSAVLSGVARAARGGVLVKGGAPLENLGSLEAIAFDKTAKLTEGRPRITDVVPVDGASEEDLLALAVAVETLSDHPLAQAIVKDGRERLGGRELPTATDLKSLTGRGVTAIVDGETVRISPPIPPISKLPLKSSENAMVRLTVIYGRWSASVRKIERA